MQNRTMTNIRTVRSKSTSRRLAGLPLAATLLAAPAASADFDVPVGVAPGSTATITLFITVTDGTDSQTDVDSIVVGVDGTGRFTISPNQPPHDGAVIQEAGFSFGGGTLNYDLFCSPILGCIPVTVNLSGLSASLVAPAQATIVGNGRADFGTFWNVRGDYTISSPVSNSAGLLDVTSDSPFGGTFAIGGGSMQVSQLTIGAIESQTTVDSLPGVLFLLRTEVNFGGTTLLGNYDPPPPNGCGGGANCGLDHAGPGCNDIACCTAVCTADPACCATDWDAGCVNLAAALCGIAPEHDNCASPRALSFGRFPFTTRNCNTDGALLITECQDVATAGAFTNDVWFTYTAPFDNGVAVSTCGHAGFDTRIAVYDGCGGTILACGDDAEGCPGGTSRVFFQGFAGETYLIRVGGKNASGDGEIDLALADVAPEYETTISREWPVSAGGNGHSYAMYALDDNTSFADLLARAAAFGGYPATITTPSESEFVRARLGVTQIGGPTAIGLVQGKGPEPLGGWGWITGEALAWTNWNAGEPNDVGGEDFAGIYPSGTWNDQGDAFGNVLIEFDAAPVLEERTWTPDEGGAGQRYRAVISPSRLTWSQAAVAAEVLGGRLVVLETEAEALWLYRELASFTALWSMTGYNGGPWVGLRKDAKSGAWNWIDGTALDWSPWGPGEPSGFGESACFYSVLDGPTRFLDDTFDGNLRRSFIVEFAPDAPCPADLDGDGMVGGSDLATMLGSWGRCKACPSDLDGDGMVGGSDLATLLGSWGACR